MSFFSSFSTDGLLRAVGAKFVLEASFSCFVGILVKRDLVCVLGSGSFVFVGSSTESSASSSVVDTLEDDVETS